MRIRCAPFALLLIAAPIAAQQMPLLTAAKQLTIDAAKNQISRISSVSVAGDGTIIALLQSDRLVKYFGKDGTPITTIGKGGGADVDFGAILQVGWVGDTLWVNDNSLKQLTLISPQRKVLRVVPLSFNPMLPSTDTNSMAPMSGGPNLPGPAIAAVYADHGYLLPVPYGPNSVMPAGWKKPARYGAAYLHVSSTGVAKSLMAWIPAPPKCDNLPQICPRALSAIAADGSAVAFAASATSGVDSGTTMVTVVGVKGDTIFSRRYPFTGVPVSKAFADSIVAAMAKQRATVRPSPGVTMPALPTFHPTVMPPITSLVIGRDGTIWIGQAAKSAARPWLVLDSKGNLIGTVSLPERVTIRAAERGMIWATEKYAVDGIDNIVRYTLGN